VTLPALHFLSQRYVDKGNVSRTIILAGKTEMGEGSVTTDFPDGADDDRPDLSGNLNRSRRKRKAKGMNDCALELSEREDILVA
jgi:hypothetical protein